MDLDQFWTLMESAVMGADNGALGDNADDEPGTGIAEELMRRLAALDIPSVLSFDAYFRRTTEDLNRWDVWAAAYLINGGCSDDSFIDFKTGVVTLGRDWHQRVVANPDALADHSAVQAAAEGASAEFLFPESVAYAAGDAIEQITGDDHAYYDLVDEAEGQEEPRQTDMGEDFDFDDPEQMTRRLPRLANMFFARYSDAVSSHAIWRSAKTPPADGSQ